MGVVKTNQEITTRELNILIVESFRYCIYRRTFAAYDCVDRIIKYWDIIYPAFQEQIQNNIEREIEVGNVEK